MRQRDGSRINWDKRSIKKSFGKQGMPTHAIAVCPLGEGSKHLPSEWGQDPLQEGQLGVGGSQCLLLSAW